MTREEAIENVRSFIGQLTEGCQASIRALIPELAESEDERMINELQAFLASYGADYFGTGQWQKFDDWLEKQKEQKPNIELIQRSWYMEGYGDRKFGNEPKWIIKTGDGGPKYEENPKYGQMLEEEQKPAEWSEDYSEEDLRTRFAFYTYKDEGSILYLSNVFVEEASRNKGFGTKILAAAEKVAETFGAIKIRLKVKQNSPANAWYRKHGYGYITFEDGYDWLEKTLEYMKPIKSEWSEEDEENFKWFDKFFRAESILIDGKDIPQDKYLWFKSLRSRPKPSDNWKPSEEREEPEYYQHFDPNC